MKQAKVKRTAKPELAPSWDLVSPSWQLLIKQFEPIIFLFILPSLLLVLGSLLLGETQHIHHIADLTSKQRLGIGLMGLSILWSIINFAPSTYFRLQATSGKATDLATCYRRGMHYFWRLVGVNLLLGILLVLGLVLFIVPGVVLFFLFIKRYYLVNYFLVDRDLGIKQALEASQHETAPYLGNIWGLIGVQVCFSFFAGAISSAARIGAVLAIFIQLVCLFLPALRYQEIKTAAAKPGKS